MMDRKGLYRFFGSVALALAYCAAGRTDGFLVRLDDALGCRGRPHPGHEAGGMVSDYRQGDGWEKGNAILATNRNLSSLLSEVTGVSLVDHDGAR